MRRVFHAGAFLSCTMLRCLPCDQGGSPIEFNAGDADLGNPTFLGRGKGLGSEGIDQGFHLIMVSGGVG